MIGIAKFDFRIGGDVGKTNASLQTQQRSTGSKHHLGFKNRRHETWWWRLDPRPVYFSFQLVTYGGFVAKGWISSTSNTSHWAYPRLRVVKNESNSSESSDIHKLEPQHITWRRVSWKWWSYGSIRLERIAGRGWSWQQPLSSTIERGSVPQMPLINRRTKLRRRIWFIWRAYTDRRSVWYRYRYVLDL